MKKIVKNIMQKHDMDNSLKLYAAKMSSYYYNFANVCLAMNYYVYYEVAKDSEENENINAITRQLVTIIEEGTVKNKVTNEILYEVDALRNKVISTMKVLTSYTDIFSRYEYILNRVEYNFKSTEGISLPDNEEFTKKIMRYIVADEDSVVVNGKIAEIIAELPIRMTKSKFFERLNEGINVYRDTDKKSLDDFLYMVRSSAMLITPSEEDDVFDDLKDIYKSLKETDYTKLSEEEYNELSGKVTYAANYIQNIVNIYMMLQQVINQLYVVLSTKKYVNDNNNDISAANSIIKYITKGFMSGENKAVYSELEDCLISLEGKQEGIHEAYMKYEHLLDEIKMNMVSDISGKDYEDCFKVLFKDEILLSDSLFVEFDVNTLEGEEMTEEYFENIKKEFLEEVEEFFCNNQRAVKRSVMAIIIASLPVFFNNLQELQDYIYTSLESCRQQSEMYACAEIINTIIDETFEFRKEE